MGTTALLYLANQICICHGPNCNSKGWAASTQTVLIVCIVACSRRRLIKSGFSGGWKWAFSIPVLDRPSLLSFLLCSLLQCFTVCCPIHLLSVTWLLCPIPSSTSYVGRAVNATFCSTWAETQEGVVASHGRKIEEPVDSLPQSSRGLVLYIVCYPHNEQLESVPFCLPSSLSAASQLSVYPNTASSSPTLPIALYLSAPRKLWDSQHVLQILSVIESLTRWLANVSGLLFRKQISLF